MSWSVTPAWLLENPYHVPGQQGWWVWRGHKRVGPYLSKEQATTALKLMEIENETSNPE